jgi:hypothetical protein
MSDNGTVRMNRISLPWPQVALTWSSHERINLLTCLKPYLPRAQASSFTTPAPSRMTTNRSASTFSTRS